MSFTIRAVQREEWVGLCRRAAEMEPWLTLGLTAEWLEAELDNDPDLVIELAEGFDAGAAIGFVAYLPRTARAEIERWHLVEAVEATAGPAVMEGGFIRDLAVFPPFQGRGVGAALMDRAERAILAAGSPRALLYVSDFNDVAVGMYRRRGYREVGRGPDMLEPQHELIVMALELVS